MIKLLITAFMSALLFDQCSSVAEQPLTDTAPITIRTGTSFGMCVGNSCRKDYVFNGTSVTLSQGGTRTQTQTPDKTCERTISAADWTSLRAAAADLDAFRKQPNVIGCPDCADGGAEYIELQQNDSRHRVTFPFGKTIPGFEPLVNALRQQREAFSDCP